MTYSRKECPNCLPPKQVGQRFCRIRWHSPGFRSADRSNERIDSREDDSSGVCSNGSVRQLSEDGEVRQSSEARDPRNNEDVAAATDGDCEDDGGSGAVIFSVRLKHSSSPRSSSSLTLTWRQSYHWTAYNRPLQKGSLTGRPYRELALI